ncbi:MAG: hypothetical protein M0Q95_15265 [Porticoccaceae bacterium]|nr:hypothetical protein [Porticoccaceae bacterium]
MDKKTFLYHEQAKLFIPVLTLWKTVLFSLIAALIISRIDFCGIFYSPYFSDFFISLSSMRVVFDYQGLQENQIVFADEAFCSIPVIYIPVKILVIAGLPLGVCGGLKNYIHFDKKWFTTKQTLVQLLILAIGILSFFFGNAGDGKDSRWLREGSFFWNNYSFYLFGFFVTQFLCGTFFLFHSSYFLTMKFLRVIKGL